MSTRRGGGAAGAAPSLLQRLHSLRHGFGWRLSERLRVSRGPYREAPAYALPACGPEESAAIDALRLRYAPAFERHLGAATSLRSYEYLDLLHRAFAQAGRDPPVGGALCDVGSANFWYVRVLQAFFRPSRLTGVEIEGYRRYRDGRSRFDYAAGYIGGLPHARFEIADYTRYAEAADVITAFFPFVSAGAILAWRLPLSLLQPEALFRRVHANLSAAGRFVMVNHGAEEAEIASRLCVSASLAAECCCVATSPLAGHRARAPVVSLWRRADERAATVDEDRREALRDAQGDDKYSYS